MDWSTLWTAVGAIATVGATGAIALTARQLEFERGEGRNRVNIEVAARG